MLFREMQEQEERWTWDQGYPAPRSLSLEGWGRMAVLTLTTTTRRRMMTMMPMMPRWRRR